MNERDLWINRLEDCLAIFADMELAEKRIKESAEDVTFARKMVDAKHHFEFPAKLIVSTIVTGVICFAVGFMFTYLSLIPVYGMEPLYSQRIKLGCTLMIVFSVFVPIIRLLILTPKAVISSKKQYEESKKSWQDSLADCQCAYDAEFNKYKAFMESRRVQSLRALLPPDYCYPQAAQQLHYYFKNGHADTLKEALRLYDSYLHRLRLENAANRRAEAAETTAGLAAEAAENSRIAANKANEAAFWNNYTAYIVSKQLSR